MDGAAHAAMIAAMIQTPGVTETGSTLSPAVLAGIIGFAGAVLGSVVGVLGGWLVWWFQQRAGEKRRVRRELVRAYANSTVSPTPRAASASAAPA